MTHSRNVAWNNSTVSWTKASPDAITYLRAVRDGLLPGSPLYELLCIDVRQAEIGRVEIAITLDESFAARPDVSVARHYRGGAGCLPCLGMRHASAATKRCLHYARDQNKLSTRHSVVRFRSSDKLRVYFLGLPDPGRNRRSPRHGRPHLL